MEEEVSRASPRDLEPELGAETELAGLPRKHMCPDGCPRLSFHPRRRLMSMLSWATVQYRSWCPHCVASRAAGQRHLSVKEAATEKPQILSDYGYMNGSGVGESALEEETGAVDEANLPILVLKDKRSGTLSASFVPAKGRDPFAVKFFRAFVEQMGHPEFINRSDGERSLLALKSEAVKETGKTAMPMESPVGDSQSNGDIESAVRR